MATYSPEANRNGTLVDHLNSALDRELDKFQTVVEKLNDISTVSVLPENKNEHRQIVRRHEQYRLAAQLQTLEKSSSLARPSKEHFVLKLTEEHFENDIYDSKELLRCLEREREAEIEKRKILGEELDRERRILAMVREQCQNDGITYEPGQNSIGYGDPAAESPELQPAQNEKVAQLEEKLKKLKVLIGLRCKQWQEFLEKHFPQLDNYDLESSSEDLFRFEEQSQGDKRPLVEIVSDLVTSYLDPACNNYIEIDSTIWKPQVEFLLRCGVAVRNPNNPSLLRLEKFAD